MNQTYTYSDFIRDIRQYKSSDIIKFSAEALHRMYHDNVPQEMETHDGRNLHLLRAFLPRISMISFAVGNEFRTASISNINAKEVLLSLCNKYLNIYDLFNDFQEYNEHYVTDLREYLNTSLSSIVNIKTFDPTSFLSFISQQIHNQWEHLTIDFYDVLRQYAIVDIFLKNNLKYREKFITQRLTCEINEFIGHAFILLTATSISNNPFGYYDTGTNLPNNFSIEVSRELGWKFDIDLLEIIADHFSGNREHFRLWHNDVMKEEEHNRKYFPMKLTNTPLFKINNDIANSLNLKIIKEAYINPSPYHFLWKMRNSLFECLSDIAINNSEEDKISHLLGIAINEYMYNALISLCGKENTKQINPSNDSQGADILLLGNKWAIIIELKKSISNKQAFTMVKPEELSFMWERLTKAFKQCSQTLSLCNDEIRDRNVLHIVCTTQNIVRYDWAYLNFARDNNIFKELNITYAQIETISSIEKNLASYSIDEYAEISTNISSQNNNKFDPNRLLHLKKYSDELGFKFI